MELEKDYEKLAVWAVTVLNSHQLTTAQLIGMAAGLADLLTEHKKNGGILPVDLVQYECLRAIVDKRQQEVVLYAEQLNSLKVPLPAIDMAAANDAVQEQFNKGYKLARASDKDAIKDTMTKILSGIPDTPIPDDEPSKD